jgi:hypothetical protein
VGDDERNALSTKLDRLDLGQLVLLCSNIGTPLECQKRSLEKIHNLPWTPPQ